MRSWSDKLHTATQALLTAVTNLHNNTHDGVLLRLVTSVTDILHLVEQLNADHRRLQRELQKERQTSQKVISRIDALERLCQTFQTTASRIQSQHSEQESGDASVRSDGRVGDSTARKNVFPQRHSTRESNQLEDKQEELERTLFPTTPRTPPPPVSPASPPHQASISPYKPPPPTHLPPLPTLKEVEAEQRQRRSQKRAVASREPPPCDKCCTKKRKMMLEQRGSVKEEVFLRWSKRPGGCIAFMHYDEPRPDGSGNNLSFKETETESPDA